MTDLNSLYIAVPAWGVFYINLAVQYTIPAIKAALGPRRGVTFIIHTDRPLDFAEVTDGYNVHFFLVPPPKAALVVDWNRFHTAHMEALDYTPKGAVAVLLNSDIVVSRETFDVVDLILTPMVKKVVVSVGVRTLITDEPPPIGATAEALAKWVWGHRHPITDACTWPAGRTDHPTTLYFDDGQGNVAVHGFHLTPMFIVKDEKCMAFNNTIDDDLLANYGESEIHYLNDREAMFCELSSAFKVAGIGPPLSVADVVKWGIKRHSETHMHNFSQMMCILGKPKRHPVVDEIIKEHYRKRAASWAVDTED